MLKRLFGVSVLTGFLSGLWALSLFAQPLEFDLINIKKAQLVFLRNAVLLEISGCFILGEGSNGIDPTTGENPAFSFSLGAGVQIISKNIQTGSFKALRGDDGVTVVGYATGPAFGSEGDTPGLVRVRLREVQGNPRPRSPDPCKREGDFWRFEIRGAVSQASRQFRQTFELTIGDDTSGEVEVQVAVRSGRTVRSTSLPPRSEPLAPLALQPVGTGELALYDLQGRLIFQSVRASPTELRALEKRLPNGVYLAVVTGQTPDGRIWQRLQKFVIRR